MVTEQNGTDRKDENGTGAEIDTRLTQPRSGPVRWELIDKDGIPISLKTGESRTFSTATAAAVHARYLWPDQEQDPDRAGKGWDVQAVGCDR